MIKELTPEQIETLKEFSKIEPNLSIIAREMGLTFWTVKKYLFPEWHQDQREKGKKRERGSRSMSPKISYNPIYDPKRDGISYHQSYTAMLMGDPLPGRSALDARKDNRFS